MVETVDIENASKLIEDVYTFQITNKSRLEYGDYSDCWPVLEVFIELFYSAYSANLAGFGGPLYDSAGTIAARLSSAFYKACRYGYKMSEIHLKGARPIGWRSQQKQLQEQAKSFEEDCWQKKDFHNYDIDEFCPMFWTVFQETGHSYKRNEFSPFMVEARPPTLTDEITKIFREEYAPSNLYSPLFEIACLDTVAFEAVLKHKMEIRGSYWPPTRSKNRNQLNMLINFCNILKRDTAIWDIRTGLAAVERAGFSFPGIIHEIVETAEERKNQYVIIYDHSSAIMEGRPHLSLRTVRALVSQISEKYTRENNL
jgi:hypothetical protein